MPIDRAATLRNAEKLLRQGKLEPAIAEYARVVDEQPRDWATANMLGDLLVRAGHIDRAVEQFTRIADHLAEEGFLPKAIAVYKKILKVKADDDRALLQAADIATAQGLTADARSFLTTLAAARVARGDNTGAAQVRIRLGTLDPDDFEARAGAARARVEMGDAAGAANEWKSIAAALTDRGRQVDAVAALREAAAIDPNDEDVRERLLAVYIATGDLDAAREYATTSAQFRQLASALQAANREDDSLAMLGEAARLDPGDRDLRTHLARAFLAKGDVPAAREYLTLETAGDDPGLLLIVAELQLRGGNADEGLAVVRRLLEENSALREQIALLSWQLAAANAEAAYRVAEAAADSYIGESDWDGAAAILQEFVTRVPNHVPALMRLVEVCVDGGLEGTLYSAQAQLADAYIQAGLASEARVISEDLIAREPWERANIDRFRRALALLGEQDPDETIAERLSGHSPFTSTDVDFGDLPSFDESPLPEAVPQVAPVASTTRRDADPGAIGLDAGRQFGLGVNAIDLNAILGDLEREFAAPRPRAADDVDGEISVPLDIVPAPETAAPQPASLDDVFAQMREAAVRKSAALGAAEAQLKRGLALQQTGNLDEAIAELEAASKAPRFRFAAASALGRIHRERGHLAHAVEWLERAAQAPAPTPDEGHQLMYDLADALECDGETARALAVCLELQADAGNYRDLAARVDRLARVQTRG